jgi:hypothetical protein
VALVDEPSLVVTTELDNHRTSRCLEARPSEHERECPQLMLMGGWAERLPRVTHEENVVVWNLQWLLLLYLDLLFDSSL